MANSVSGVAGSRHAARYDRWAPARAGVDNGQLWFDHVRVPRDALLDAFASVGADGAYSSAIPSVSQRFGTMVGGLTTGAPRPRGRAAACLW